MDTRIVMGAVALLAAAALTACEPGDSTDGRNNGVTGETTTRSAAATRPVPTLVGKGLQAAQDAAQAAGFDNLASHDALGEARHQILDRDWKVCTQTPAAGVHSPVDTRIDLGAVKITESCPKNGEVPPPAKTGKVMPDFIGKGLKAAQESLPSDASILTKDASGQGRVILLASHWKVCGQDPKPGAAYSGQPVTLTAVKTGETCP